MQRFVWDGDQLLYEVRARGDSAGFSYGVEDDLLDGNGIYGALKAYGRVGYTHAGGIDRPIGAVRGTTPFYPHTNARGLYENATIDNGTLLTNGVAWPGQSASAYLGWTPRSTPYEWFGSLVTEQADASGLLYRRNRYYDPQVGRFTQPDPIGIAGGLNSYGFANGDPVNFSDPFGLCPQCLVGALVGVGTGYAIAALTGGDYGWQDLAVDAALGAVGGGLVSKLDKLNDLRKGSRAIDGASDVVRGTAKQERTLAEHTGKLDKYKANPDAFDSKGFLKNAPSQEVRERIIQARVKHLENEIRAIRKAIDEIRKGGT